MSKRFTYAAYEAACRSAGYHTARRYLGMITPIFRGCKSVLDVGCGQGLFLDLLHDQGTPRLGVDIDAQLLETVRTRGLQVVCADALEFLRTTPDHFDGLFCAHVIEHLTFETLLDLLEAACTRLTAGGKLVIIFPNPASLTMQLNYFWRDPTHVRFYQRDLITAVLMHFGLQIDPAFPAAISSGWASLAEAYPSTDGWSRFKRGVRNTVRRQLEIDHALLAQPEDVLIVARR